MGWHCQITQSEIPGTFLRNSDEENFFAFLAELGHLEQKKIFFVVFQAILLIKHLKRGTELLLSDFFKSY